VVLPGWVLSLRFQPAARMGEFPLVVDAFVVLAFILMVFEFVLPLLKARLSDSMSVLGTSSVALSSRCCLPGWEFCAGARSRRAGAAFSGSGFTMLLVCS